MGVLMGVRERVGQAMDRRLIDLAMGVPGIEHYERPEYQDELQLLRGQRAALANIPDATIGNVGLAIRSVATIGLLAAIHPVLAFLPLFGIPSLVLGGATERRRQRFQEHAIERERAYNWLYHTATERDLGKELRVFGAGWPILRRHDRLSDEVVDELSRSEAKTSLLSASGWLVFAAGFFLAVWLVVEEARSGRATPGDVVLALGVGPAGQQPADGRGVDGLVPPPHHAWDTGSSGSPTTPRRRSPPCARTARRRCRRPTGSTSASPSKGCPSGTRAPRPTSSSGSTSCSRRVRRWRWSATTARGSRRSSSCCVDSTSRPRAGSSSTVAR